MAHLNVDVSLFASNLLIVQQLRVKIVPFMIKE